MLLLILHFVFDAHYLCIYTFYLCVHFLSGPALILLFSPLHHLPPLVINGRERPVLLFKNILVMIVPCQHIYYIRSLSLQGILLVNYRYLPLIPLKELMFWIFSSLLTFFEVGYTFGDVGTISSLLVKYLCPPSLILCSCFLMLTLVISWCCQCYLIYWSILSLGKFKFSV